MSIFNLHSNVVSDYRDFVRSFFTVADDRAREFIDRKLVEQARLWPEALLQVSPSYARVASVDQSADQGVLLRETAEILRTDSCSPFEILELNERGGAPCLVQHGQPFHLYQHQVEALELARRGETYVVTSGTGSGKSLTYFLPIIDSFLRQPPPRDRIAALVVHPMNALVNSQHEALKKLKRGYEQRTGRRFPINFAKYTGDVQGEPGVRCRRIHRKSCSPTTSWRNSCWSDPTTRHFLVHSPLAIRHSPLPTACGSLSSTNCTPTAVARVRTLRCSSGA